MDRQDLEDPQDEEHHRRDEKQDQTENQEHFFAGEKVSTIMRRSEPFRAASFCMTPHFPGWEVPI